MPLFPFTQVGVQSKIDELYSLPDSVLMIEAEAIKKDFNEWMKANFLLSEVQIEFLDGISDSVTIYYGEQCSTCFLNRLPINLIYPDPPIDSEYSKWIGSNNDIEVKTEGSGESDVSGSLTFTISYI